MVYIKNNIIFTRIFTELAEFLIKESSFTVVCAFPYHMNRKIETVRTTNFPEIYALIKEYTNKGLEGPALFLIQNMPTDITLRLEQNSYGEKNFTFSNNIDGYPGHDMNFKY